MDAPDPDPHGFKRRGVLFVLSSPSGAGKSTIARKLREVSIAAVTSPGMTERFRKIAADIAAPERRTPEYLQGYVESEIKKWAAPVKASGASAE